MIECSRHGDFEPWELGFRRDTAPIRPRIDVRESGSNCKEAADYLLVRFVGCFRRKVNVLNFDERRFTITDNSIATVSV